MIKLAVFAAICVAFLGAAPAVAQGADDSAGPGGYSFHLFPAGAAFGCALIIIGAAYGISKIGSSAVESMARQPEIASNINTAMLVSAALIEGATFFALIVILLEVIFAG